MLRCRGMRDLLPQDMVRFRRIEDVFRERCYLYGYQEVRSPTLEYLHCFTSTGTLTPHMLRSVYSFLDWDGWSGERVVLRPDGTIPLARLFVDNFPQDNRLHRFFYVENNFRFTESAEETRERWQCGAELLGSSHPEADVELILLAREVLSELELPSIRVAISHAGILRNLLRELGLGDEEQSHLFDEIQEGHTQALAQAGKDRPSLARLLPLLLEAKGDSSGFLRNLKVVVAGEFPALAPDFDRFIQVTDLLSALGCPYEIDLALPGGFEYYTGILFQLFVDGLKVGGGGRYDELVSLVGGSPIPSSGFALYMDRLMQQLDPRQLHSPQQRRVILRPPRNSPQEAQSWFELAGLLRRKGWVALLDLGYPNSEASPWTVRPSPEGGYLVEETSSGRKVQVPAGEPEGVLRALEAGL
jgi:histidyl-tRNA synthetase